MHVQLHAQLNDWISMCVMAKLHSWQPTTLDPSTHRCAIHIKTCKKKCFGKQTSSSQIPHFKLTVSHNMRNARKSSLTSCVSIRWIHHPPWLPLDHAPISSMMQVCGTIVDPTCATCVAADGGAGADNHNDTACLLMNITVCSPAMLVFALINNLGHVCVGHMLKHQSFM